MTKKADTWLEKGTLIMVDYDDDSVVHTFSGNLVMNEKGGMYAIYSEGGCADKLFKARGHNVECLLMSGQRTPHLFQMWCCDVQTEGGTV